MKSEQQLKRFKKWLIDLGMTQAQIAEECGVSQGYVSLVISGKRKSKKVTDFFLSRGCPRELLDTISTEDPNK
jgi:transcriptional regulator with XRE-family HTH domain